MTEHNLKCWPEHFAPLRDGTKTCELRLDDRGFAVGDTLVLWEWDSELYADARADGCTTEEASAFATTGRTHRVMVTHVLRGGPWLAPGYVAMSVRPAP